MESSPPLRNREIENDNCVEKVTRTCRNTKDIAMLLPEFLSWRITSTVLSLIRLAFLFYLEIFKAQKCGVALHNGCYVFFDELANSLHD